MFELTATFRAFLSSPILCVETVPNLFRPLRPEDPTVELAVPGGHASIELAGFTERGHGTIGGPMAREATEIVIRVVRQETEAPPDPSDREASDESALKSYVDARLPLYSGIAATLLTNLLTFFRYEMGNPLVQARWHAMQPSMLNPVWNDDRGDIIWDSVTTHFMDPRPALDLFPRCGVKAYRSEDRQSLLDALKRQLNPTFLEELLAEARDALALGQLRRSILELAIACEVGVKHRYFQPDSHAESAYSYLEDKNKVNVRVLDFLDGIALRTFGHSLRLDRPDCYRDIDFLFRCRNKVAHRGVLTFRDDGGTEITAHDAYVVRWFGAVTEMFAWLEQMSARA